MGTLIILIAVCFGVVILGGFAIDLGKRITKAARLSKARNQYSYLSQVVGTKDLRTIELQFEDRRLLELGIPIFKLWDIDTPTEWKQLWIPQLVHKIYERHGAASFDLLCRLTNHNVVYIAAAAANQLSIFGERSFPHIQRFILEHDNYLETLWHSSDLDEMRRNCGDRWFEVLCGCMTNRASDAHQNLKVLEALPSAFRKDLPKPVLTRSFNLLSNVLPRKNDPHTRDLDFITECIRPVARLNDPWVLPLLAQIARASGLRRALDEGGNLTSGTEFFRDVPDAAREYHKLADKFGIPKDKRAVPVPDSFNRLPDK